MNFIKQNGFILLFAITITCYELYDFSLTLFLLKYLNDDFKFIKVDNYYSSIDVFLYATILYIIYGIIYRNFLVKSDIYSVNFWNKKSINVIEFNKNKLTNIINLTYLN